MLAVAATAACLGAALPAYGAPGDPAPASAATPVPGQVVAGGMVPDEATKASVRARLRELYGSANVVDQIEVGNVVSPPNWTGNVQKILSPQIKRVNLGQLNIDGTQVAMHGDVQNEAQRQQLASDMATTLGASYTIKNGLRVAAVSEQSLLDQTLANRIIEFETGSATLTPKGRGILDEMAAVMPRLNGRKIEIVGHTDNSGSPAMNLNLSQTRTETVKNDLISKGAEPGTLVQVYCGRCPNATEPRPGMSTRTADFLACRREHPVAG
ncbi:Outer membrane protein A [Ralstonia syzygii subsp. syzygii]|nr:Outer membrane protein A [Ralstonia syzygii subsp. syzygii]